MELTNTHLQELCDVAINAALTAGKFIREYSRDNLIVDRKNAGTSEASQVFTQVDIKSQQIIIDCLLPTLDHYHLALLSEERDDDKSRFEKDYFWCIDPLDGTLPYIEQCNGYSVSIALVSKGGVSQIGVIFDLVEGILYSAIIGKGAYKSGKRWSVDNVESQQKNPFTLIVDRSFKLHEYYNNTLAFIGAEFVKNKQLDIRDYGGGAMNAIWGAEFAPACYLKYPKPKTGGGSLWDFAASSCICSEAGIKVSDIYGNPLDLNRPDSTFMNHRGVLYASDSEISEAIIKNYNLLTK